MAFSTESKVQRVAAFYSAKQGHQDPEGASMLYFFWLKRYLDSQSACSSGMGHPIYVTWRICGNIYIMYGNNYVLYGES